MGGPSSESKAGSVVGTAGRCCTGGAFGAEVVLPSMTQAPFLGSNVIAGAAALGLPSRISNSLMPDGSSRSAGCALGGGAASDSSDRRLAASLSNIEGGGVGAKIHTKAPTLHINRATDQVHEKCAVNNLTYDRKGSPLSLSFTARYFQNSE